MEHEIGTWFLILSLFIPRFVLFFWWLAGNLPYNTTPLMADFLGALFFPRVLILVYIYDIQHFSPWFWIHLGVLFLVGSYNIATFQTRYDDAVKNFNKIKF